LRKLIVAFGLIFICIGTALMYNYNTKELGVATKVVAAQSNSWSVNSALNKDDNVEIRVTPPTDWETGRFDDMYLEGENVPRPVLHTYVTISPLQGNSTLFEVNWTLFANFSGLKVWPPIFLLQKISPSNLTRVSVPDLKTDCLNTTVWYIGMNGFSAAGGTVEFTSVYTISVGDLYPSRTTPPSRIEIVRRTLQITYPNSFFLPTGAVVVVAGVIVTFFGLRAQPKKFRSKRNRHALQKKANR